MEDLFTFLLEPIRFEFMVRGLLAAILVGIVCAVIGTFVVLRGMAFLGDALAHAMLPGVAIGYLVSGGNTATLFWWGLGAALITSIGVGGITRGARVKEDTAIGVMFVSMFALGIALISGVRSYAVDLTHLLFGNVLGVSNTDLWLVGIFGSVVVITVLLFYKEFVTIAFDEVHATTIRLPVNVFNYVLLVLIAIAIVVSLQTVGIALMLAMLVNPAATAFLLTRRLPTMMALASLFGALSGVIGLYLSFYISIASGAAIVLVSTGFFVLAFLFAPQRGWVWRLFRGNGT
ncbi:MAG: metal ABC transporter permease [Chloroflexi bacterium AL-W]|nr:metal ABC transporter permease [Chloroflexi bacterium AL-N1]NOK66018.1 metal ABC transporter permease [Chloroflexi bacterium AL-N10]NOK72899.1 metal ABC transporter permease [Chloroflexi bacterium AL-N5]NOK79796.1 metal ABC transporter permease [Chloroflexi bacterium AL-W]NOK88348.1 metal ABC transporter permease [Chloroflexi bacterium AL-N15]